MNLRLKILLTLIGVFSLFVVIDSAIHQFVVFPRFLALEQQEAQRNIARSHRTLEHDITHLEFFSQGQSVWQRVRDHWEQHLSEPRAGLEKLASESRLHLVAVVEADGRVAYQQLWGDAPNVPIALAAFPSEIWPREHGLLGAITQSGETNAVTSGLVATEQGPMQVIAAAMDDRLTKASPLLVIGRFLDAGTLATLAQRVAPEFQVQSIDQLSEQGRAELPEPLQQFLAGACDQAPTVVTALDSSSLAVHSVISDMTGKPLLVTRALVGRSIAQHGQIAMRYAIGSLLVAAFLMLTILLVLLQPIVISPLTALAEHASNIGRTGDLTARSPVKRSDEFGDLAQHFDAMVENLAETQSRLIEVSRKAGMSDAATGVIHNVGNVMTNVNVLSSSMTSRLENSKLAGLKKSAELIRSHEHQLSEFLVSDPRGQKLPQYICQVTDHVEQEHLEILQQLRAMSANLEHVAQLLSAQQKLATGASVLEPVRLERVVQDAIGMLQASLDGHRVQLRLESEELPVLRVDRGKVIQILVNLIANAKDAVKHLSTEYREIVIRLRTDHDQWVAIDVIDQGCGIEPENLKKVFASGFTTKVDGHGHGLHFCALAAKELSGALQVRSDGPGCGATFTLTLPRSAVREKVGS